MRIERIGDAALYLCDYLELLHDLVADAVISDPPYGINYTRSGGERRFSKVGQTKASKARGVPPIVGDAAPFDPTHLLRFDNLLLWGADHYRERLPNGGRFLAWDKLDGMEPWDSFSDVEFAWHSKAAASRIFGMKWKGIACDKRGESNGVREHPTQKPVALMIWSIQQAGTPRRVLDPYMGSGTTGVAAARLGCEFIGIEIAPRWFEIACRRIDEAQRQPNLFSEVDMSPMRAEQSSLF